MNCWLAFLPLVLLVAVIVVGGFLLVRGGERPTFTEGMIGRAAPAFALQPLNAGEPVSSEAMAGRPYMINVFASYCAPCRVEHPELLALQARGVPIVGVAYKDTAEDAQHYLDELRNPFVAVGQDPEGRFGLELGVTGMPETVVVGADGVVRAHYRGALTEEVVQRVIMPAFERAPG